MFTYTPPLQNNYYNKVAPLTKNRFAVCTREGIMIWKSKPKYEMIHLLQSNNDAKICCCLQLKNKIHFVSSEIFGAHTSDTSLVKIWNLKHYQCETVFKGVGTKFTKGLVEITGNYLLVGSNDIVIINTKNLKIEKIIKTENNLVFSTFIEMKNKLIICREDNEFLYYFYMKSFKLKKLKAHCDRRNSTLAKINDTKFICNNGELYLTIWEITRPQNQNKLK